MGEWSVRLSALVVLTVESLDRLPGIVTASIVTRVDFRVICKVEPLADEPSSSISTLTSCFTSTRSSPSSIVEGVRKPLEDFLIFEGVMPGVEAIDSALLDAEGVGREARVERRGGILGGPCVTRVLVGKGGRESFGDNLGPTLTTPSTLYEKGSAGITEIGGRGGFFKSPTRADLWESSEHDWTDNLKKIPPLENIT